MSKICTNKEYETFNIFYEKGYSLAQEIKKLTQGQSAGERVSFARTYIPKDTLNGCMFINRSTFGFHHQIV